MKLWIFLVRLASRHHIWEYAFSVDIIMPWEEDWLLWSISILYVTLLSGNLVLTYLTKYGHCWTVCA